MIILMKEKSPINAKKFVFKLINFFLLIIIFTNLIGNFFGISSDYTYYHWGLNSIAILSRYIENSVLDIGMRIFLLGLTSMLSSALLFLLYHFARRGKTFPLVLSIIIYIIDYALVFSPWYRESSFSYLWSSFIHLVLIALILASALLFLLINPGGDKDYYDFTK
ncbi:MAG: hypothetical protein BWX57_00767 [Tenericutes bacterium ADurb.Bin024]|jgi:hypothetical protein|nr:MAG: hypothetical protein BWX57_00767 [Tenericutes bacterium ADurb.Bin024]